MNNTINSLVSVEFEVFGKVQGMNFYTHKPLPDNKSLLTLGVYFTKYCKEMSEDLGITGWVKNTKKGTIQGKLQGSKGSVEQM